MIPIDFDPNKIEEMNPKFEVCLYCNGEGIIYITTERFTCPDCFGIGSLEVKMREIGFRAWDKELKRMCDVYAIDFLTKQISVGFVGASSVYSWEPLERFILLPYIGLKNKNGVWIYGGDILLNTSPYAGLEIAVVKWNAEYARYEFAMYYDGEGKTFETLSLETWTSIDHFKIIGNIYENPELLEGTNK